MLVNVSGSRWLNTPVLGAQDEESTIGDDAAAPAEAAPAAPIEIPPALSSTPTETRR